MINGLSKKKSNCTDVLYGFHFQSIANYCDTLIKRLPKRRTKKKIEKNMRQKIIIKERGT